jgi:chromatin remodeling complex protein RSC6
MMIERNMIKSKKLVCDITPQLAEFLGEPGQTKMSRTEVTRRIDAYIQKKHLQDVMNPTNIYPDKKLMTLLLSAFAPNPRPYPKMITFEMLRDMISNHCIFTRYEDYYYRVPGVPCGENPL